MAWRSNKEAAHAAYCALGGTAQQEARRDQIINNARTNWELLRFLISSNRQQSFNVRVAAWANLVGIGFVLSFPCLCNACQ